MITQEGKPANVSNDVSADDQATKENPVQRYVPLVCWVIVVLTLLLISFKIMSSGFMPGGDGRRHVARALIDKPYREIVIMRPEYKMDHSPGWERLLHVLHQQTGWDADALMGFSIVFCMLTVVLIPLFWVRRPEAWLAALLSVLVVIPELMNRFVQARPFVLTEGLLMAILFSWSKPDTKAPSWTKLLLTTAAIAVSVWMHGAWYLWVLPLAAFFLAGWWWQALWLSVCFGAGTFAGAALTGHPVVFLKQAVEILLSISGEKVPLWMVVGELEPNVGVFGMLTLVALVFLWRKQQGTAQSRLFCAPVLWLAAISWILGFRADRFWTDWGMPAVIVWLTLQFEEISAGAWNMTSPRRVLAAGFLALPLFLHTTNDLDSRYSRNLREPFLDGKAASMEGWTPEPGGIFYHSQMQFFYNTFYKNPQAQWRYILGFEPTLMTVEDLKILRTIQMNPADAAVYEPWIKRMTPADRLVIYTSSQPDLPALEWHHAVANIWIGRLPRAAAR